MRAVPVKEAMVTQVVSARENDSLAVVEAMMRHHHIRHLAVLDESTGLKLVGIITYWDILHHVLPRRTEEGEYFDPEQMEHVILKHVMTKNPVAVHPDDPLKTVVDMMALNKYGCIPIVTETQELVGIITQIDILKFLSKWLNA